MGRYYLYYSTEPFFNQKIRDIVKGLHACCQESNIHTGSIDEVMCSFRRYHVGSCDRDNRGYLLLGRNKGNVVLARNKVGTSGNAVDGYGYSGNKGSCPA